MARPKVSPRVSSQICFVAFGATQILSPDAVERLKDLGRTLPMSRGDCVASIRSKTSTRLARIACSSARASLAVPYAPRQGRGMNETQRLAARGRRAPRTRPAARHRSPDPRHGVAHRRPRTGRPPPITTNRSRGLTAGNVCGRNGVHGGRGALAPRGGLTAPCRGLPQSDRGEAVTGSPASDVLGARRRVARPGPGAGPRSCAGWLRRSLPVP